MASYRFLLPDIEPYREEFLYRWASVACLVAVLSRNGPRYDIMLLSMRQPKSTQFIECSRR